MDDIPRGGLNENWMAKAKNRREWIDLSGHHLTEGGLRSKVNKD